MSVTSPIHAWLEYKRQSNLKASSNNYHKSITLNLIKSVKTEPAYGLMKPWRAWHWAPWRWRLSRSYWRDSAEQNKKGRKMLRVWVRFSNWEAETKKTVLLAQTKALLSQFGVTSNSTNIITPSFFLTLTYQFGWHHQRKLNQLTTHNYLFFTFSPKYINNYHNHCGHNPAIIASFS